MLTTRRVLFRQTGQNATTPMDPVYEVVAEEGTRVTYRSRAGVSHTCNTTETVSCCIASDFDMLTEVPLWEVRNVVLPEWLSTREWLAHTTRWKWVWGLGADPEWSEAWQRGLAAIPDTGPRLAAIQLLTVQNFRSEFRAKMRDLVVTWLETPAADRKYSTPLSPRQTAVVGGPRFGIKVERADRNLYYNRTLIGAQKTV